MHSNTIRYNYSDFDAVKQVALTFPETEEGVSHEGTPSVKVRHKLMCRLHESGAFVSLRLDFDLRDRYLNSHPEIFHLPEHFKKWPYVAMSLSVHDKGLLRGVLELSWRALATKKALKEYDAMKAVRT